MDVSARRVEGEGRRTRAGCLDIALLVSRASNQWLKSPARYQRPGGCEPRFAHGGSGQSCSVRPLVASCEARHGEHPGGTQEADRRFEDAPLDGSSGEWSRENTGAGRRLFLRLGVERGADSRRIFRRVAPLSRSGANDWSPALRRSRGNTAGGREALSPFWVLGGGQQPARARVVKGRGCRCLSEETGGRGGGGGAVGGGGLEYLSGL